jgi:uncharacterized YigZ family protein
MHDYFFTLSGTSEGLYKSKGSKFLAFACPVHSEEEIKEILEEKRKEFHDARHHCYAWLLGADGENFRANDDGEPSNSAGKPILGQIKAFDLTNVLVIVIRYFGGTLLGVGGLITAYKTAGREALAAAKIKKVYIKDTCTLHFKYPDLNPVMRVLKDMDISDYQQEFGIDCKMNVKVRKSLTQKFVQALAAFPGIKVTRVANPESY